MDFIVYGADIFYAIEVKNSHQVHAKDVKPLQIFLQDYAMATAILLYRGTEWLKFGAVLCIPVKDFLLNMIPNQKLLP